MTLTEGLLITIVIILTIWVITSSRKNASPGVKTWDCVDKNSGEVTTVKLQYTPPEAKSPEKTALNENAEYFTASSSGSAAPNYQCDDDDKFAYAVSSFGTPGMDYKDWVANQSVDPQVMKNHAEFVKDRTSDNSKNVTGRTYAMPDDIESASAVPWIGLRRPQALPDEAKVGSLQIPDINPNDYSNKAKFTWSSS